MDFTRYRSCISTALGHREHRLHQTLPRAAGRATKILDWLTAIPGDELPAGILQDANFLLSAHGSLQANEHFWRTAKNLITHINKRE